MIAMTTLTVEDPACIGLTSDEIDAQSTPEWDAVVAQLGNPLEVAS